LPSVFTTFNLFLGYTALLHILKENYITAIYLVTLSMVMDGFDGTIARLTKTESNFGMQLDSLVDAVSFGLVTSIFIYKWGFPLFYPQLGKVAGFIFLSAGVIRLARFNVYKEVKAYPSNIFIGLPIPLAALSVLSVGLLFKGQPMREWESLLFAAFCIIVGVLMISNVKYRTLKRIDPRYSLLVLFILACLVAFTIMFPTRTIPMITGLYLVSPIIFFIIGKFKKPKKPPEMEAGEEIPAEQKR
jgi:CDP-diacylglycerol--serine O-phosphatidyltransferase